ncbi:hypothetical protein GH714_039127 [Hevea brasiliensis]|uniref:Uncharacterized protein n=1 Tax=Hevea brasiliensis TaxID=3981 RepID=A0A6A6MS66_HEVBR|nr:hypothetical protein GH714_039127 [Hevea brasiliensis]
MASSVANLREPDMKVLDASWYMPDDQRNPFQESHVAHIPGALFCDVDGITNLTTNLPYMVPSEEAFAAAVSALELRIRMGWLFMMARKFLVQLSLKIKAYTMSHLEIERARILREREQKEREQKDSEEASNEGNSSTVEGGLFPEKEGSVTLKYPMLTKSNYVAWAIKMEVFMMAQGVWDAVESPGLVDKRRDKMALAAIYQGIGEDTLLQLGAKKTAKEAWNMLKTMNQGADKVKEVRTQTLWREFKALRMSDSENVDDFSGKLTIIDNKLRSLVEDEKVLKKLLRSVSSKFLQIASTIEEFSDLTTKSIEEVIGSLKAHKERLLSYGGRSDETVLLTRAEWKAREEAKKNKGK